MRARPSRRKSSFSLSRRSQIPFGELRALRSIDDDGDALIARHLCIERGRLCSAACEDVDVLTLYAKTAIFDNEAPVRLNNAIEIRKVDDGAHRKDLGVCRDTSKRCDGCTCSTSTPWEGGFVECIEADLLL